MRTTALDAEKLPAYPECVGTVIERAFAAMEGGKGTEGLRLFRQARSLTVEQCDQEKLNQIIEREQSVLIAETKTLKKALDDGADAKAERRVLIFSDSLGLPRPDREDKSTPGYDGVFAFKLQQQLRHREAGPINVTGWCQRYLTSDGVVSLLPRLSPLIKGADVVAHVGLNDCANRIFLVRERHAVSLLPKATGARLVEFGRIYRRAIISSDANYAYVPLPRFAANMTRMAALCRQHGARRLILCTIVMPPMRTHSATPNMPQNFTRYNLTVYEQAQKLKATVLDCDRLMWENGNTVTLLPDGMHLAEPGHQVMADALRAIVSAG